LSSAPAESEAWLPAAFNRGHAYRDRVDHPAPSIAGFYAGRYRHSDRSVWIERLAAGEICCNGQQLHTDAALAAGDRLVWFRPPWQEAAVPVLSERSIVFDDGDLLVLNKPSGLPVLPAGGFLVHTLLTQLEQWVRRGMISASGGVPRPVHRLGRFTSGLLVCARRSDSRAWLSAQLRESTLGKKCGEPGDGCRKIYRALTQSLPADWQIAEARRISSSIGLKSHLRLGMIWCHVSDSEPHALPSLSEIKLLERRESSCLVEVTITTGRPHQIRIHTAVIGAPLLGDPLYVSGGLAQPHALPGEGGYHLHAHRFNLFRENRLPLELSAPLPGIMKLSEPN